MRILKQLSLLLCVLMLASQAHAMLRGCMSIAERYIVRNPNVFGAAGIGANYLNNGGRPNLLPAQQAAFAGGNPSNPLYLQHVQHYTTMQQGGGFSVDDEDEEDNVRVSPLTGTPAFLEQLQAEREDRYANNDNDEDFIEVKISEIPNDSLQRAQAALDVAFAGIAEDAPTREIGSVIEDFRRRIILDRTLLNFVNHVELDRLAEVHFDDPAKAFIAGIVVHTFPNRNSIGYTSFMQMLADFERNPVQFLVDLEVSEGVEGGDVD